MVTVVGRFEARTGGVYKANRIDKLRGGGIQFIAWYGWFDVGKKDHSWFLFDIKREKVKSNANQTDIQ